MKYIQVTFATAKQRKALPFYTGVLRRNTQILKPLCCVGEQLE